MQKENIRYCLAGGGGVRRKEATRNTWRDRGKWRALVKALMNVHVP
jgi:hypothetical protein